LAGALDFVVVQIEGLTLDGVVEGDCEALKAVGMARDKEGLFRRWRRSREREELRLVWNALQFQGLGKGGVSGVSVDLVWSLRREVRRWRRVDCVGVRLDDANLVFMRLSRRRSGE
jgi:hypothetical protein